MPRKDLSKIGMQERVNKANEERAARASQKKEYDAAYRKSNYFKVTLVIRSIMIVFCLYIFLFDSLFFGTKVETVVSCEIEKDIITPASKGRGAQDRATYAFLTTTEGNTYNVSLEPKGNERSFAKGDTIIVQHTIVHKPSYISNAHGTLYFPTKAHTFFRPMFLLLGLASVASLFMLSGYDKASKSFVRFITFAGVAFLLIYLIMG